MRFRKALASVFVFVFVLGAAAVGDAAARGGGGGGGHGGFSGGHVGGGGGFHASPAFHGHSGHFDGRLHGFDGRRHDFRHFHGFIGVDPFFAWGPGYVDSPPVYGDTGEYWYYCSSAGAYYPYVTSCPEVWVPVTPN